jgi:hypothetical protein
MPNGLIPKPNGHARRDYKIFEAMGFESQDNPQYKAIIVSLALFSCLLSEVSAEHNTESRPHAYGSIENHGHSNVVSDTESQR